MTNRGFGSRFSEMAIEAALVVFAVMIALAVEEWREEAQLEEFAERAEMAVRAEIQANLDEVAANTPSITRAITDLAPLRPTDSDFDPTTVAVDLDLADFSTGAWEAARMTQAAGRIDFEWVIEVSRTYDVMRITSDMQGDIIDQMALLIGGQTDTATYRLLFGRLVVLNQTYETLQEMLEALLEE